MARLWRNNPQTPEGKYLVKRRDGSIPEWPNFVLGARDPISPWALRLYAILAFFMRYDRQYAKDVWNLATSFALYRKRHGNGDPDGKRHRVDDPATINEMRTGNSS